MPDATNMKTRWLAGTYTRLSCFATVMDQWHWPRIHTDFRQSQSQLVQLVAGKYTLGFIYIPKVARSYMPLVNLGTPKAGYQCSETSEWVYYNPKVGLHA